MKIDDDDTAHIAQTELAGEFVGGAEIDVEGIDFLSFGAFAAVAGVDVDHVKGFGVLNDEIGPVLVSDGARRGDLIWRVTEKLSKMGTLPL